MSERLAPFHCPYCGEEDLFPHEPTEAAPRGGWECRACLRAFSITLLGHLQRPGSATPGGAR